jgi:hypothetical protein
MRDTSKDGHGVLVQLRIAKQERARWVAAAAKHNWRIGELIRQAVRDRVFELERHAFLLGQSSASTPPPSSEQTARAAV